MNWVSGLGDTLLSRGAFFRTGPRLKSIHISELQLLAHEMGPYPAYIPFLCLSTEVATKVKMNIIIQTKFETRFLSEKKN